MASLREESRWVGIFSRSPIELLWAAKKKEIHFGIFFKKFVTCLFWSISFLWRYFPFFWKDYSCWLGRVNNRPFWLKNSRPSITGANNAYMAPYFACIFNKSKPRWSQYILWLRISNILYFGLYCVRGPDHKSGWAETLRFLETFLGKNLAFMLISDFLA